MTEGHKQGRIKDPTVPLHKQSRKRLYPDSYVRINANFKIFRQTLHV